MPPFVQGRSQRREAEQAPVREAGGGAGEGFEEAERELIDHASHGDQHTAHRVIGDAPNLPEDERAAEEAEPDTATAAERDG